MQTPNVPKGIFAAVARGGIKFDIVKSGFQKGIRRNLPDLAVPLSLRGLELGLMNKSVMSNLLNRMVVICGEDIGPACVPAVKAVNKLITDMRGKQIQSEADKRDLEIQLCSLVAYMCSQKKTRVVSFIRAYYGTAVSHHPDLLDENLMKKYKEIDSQPGSSLQKWERCLESPYPYLSVNYALQMMANKQSKVEGVNMMPLLGRKTNKVSLMYACWLKLYEKVADKETVKILFQWFREENEEHIYLIFAHVLLNEPDKCSYEVEKYELQLEKWRRLAYEETIEIPSFVVDLHTKKGRATGAGKLKFALEGSKVENEYTAFANLDAMKEVYVEIKKREDATQPEVQAAEPAKRAKVRKAKEPAVVVVEKPVVAKKALVRRKTNNVVNIEKLRSIIEVKEFTEEHNQAIVLKDTYVGQIISAKWKPQTYMVREGPLKGQVIKGPFPLKEKMLTLASRVRGFDMMNCRTSPLKFLVDTDGQIWLQMEAFATVPAEEWRYEERMDTILGRMVKTVVRESLGTKQMWNKTMEEVRQFMFGEYFLFGDYIVAAAFGCGDMGIWNCLASDTDAIIIDFEDSTTRKSIDNAWEVFAKCPHLKYRTMFRDGAIQSRVRILQVIESLESHKQELMTVGVWRQEHFDMVKNFFAK